MAVLDIDDSNQRLKQCAVLTSNMQVAMANKHSARKASVEKFLPSLVSFLCAMRQKSIPIIHLKLAYPDHDPRSREPFGCFPPLTQGSAGVDLLPDIVEPSDLIIEKTRDSGFFKTNLHEVLQDLNVKTVIITGMQAYSCVQFTAVDASFRGYDVIINHEAIGSTRQEDTAHSILTMEKYCAKIYSSQEIQELV